MTCSTCQHFLSRGVIDASAEPGDLKGPRWTGVCRRHPPRIESVTWAESTPEGFSVFPLVHPDQHCGEFCAAVPL